jgi:hypothetical protein
MFIKVDSSGYEYQNNAYWLNINKIISFTEHENYIDVMIDGWEENIKIKNSALDLIKKITAAQQGLVIPSDLES